MNTRDSIVIVCKCIVAICLILLAVWLVLMWVCLWPFRLALHRQQQPRTHEELTALLAVAMAGVALLRSGRPSLTMREWKRARRRLYDARPDDTIPF